MRSFEHLSESSKAARQTRMIFERREDGRAILDKFIRRERLFLQRCLRKTRRGSVRRWFGNAGGT
jgi:hypothetical protein